MNRLVPLWLLLFSANTSAALVDWTLKNVRFDDGGTASGSFTLDTDTGLLSNVAITTTDGTEGWIVYCDEEGCIYEFFPGSNIWAGEYSETGGESQFSYADPDPEYPFSLSFTFSGELDGGLDRYAITGGGQSDTDGGSAFYRSVVGGHVTAVPLPAAIWLFVSALGVLGWQRRSRVPVPA